MPTLWDLLRRKYPKEVHLRIKKYSLDEVLQDSNWLFKKWAEKDRQLSHFARHQQFPIDSRGYGRLCDTRNHNLEASVLALFRLLLLPCTVPFLLFLSVPFFWAFLWIWLGQKLYQFIFHTDERDDRVNTMISVGQRTPGSANAGTPYVPATPFVSPSPFAWRDVFSPR